jgi:UDP-N-acetylmuramate: L-alanyl-gamma-D-glutamyl-meso-diaminopimelate ligase
VPRFQGVRRRQQCLLKEPVFLIDDFAHHPTEVAATLNSVRMRFPSSRIWAFFEPRSATARRATHQEEYFKSFEKADFILLSVPYKNQELSEAERFSPQAVTNKLTEMGKTAQTMGGAQEIIDYFLKNYKTGDVVVVMSNGEFDRIQEKLSKALS